jgi:anaerobic magnesium-protoporphyrin IX monomethyl ester cyclase
MKIALVEAPAPWLVRPHAQAPLGLLYLASVLKCAGHEVVLARPKIPYDLNDYSDCQVMAFSGTTLEYPSVLECARWMRQYCGHVGLWYGGVHATAMPGEVMRRHEFDFVGIGEAEGYIAETAEAWEKHHYHNSAGKWEWSPQDLDALPFPDRSLLGGRRGDAIFAFHEGADCGSENIITSRGCAYDCAFCGSCTMWGRKVRWRSAGNVIEEVRQIVDSGCRQIRFEDDNVPANRPRLREMAPRLEELGIVWHCSARAQDLRPETCDLLVKSGCREVSVGIESADQRVLDCLNKRVTVEELRAGCQTATSAGLHVRALWMTGTPGERADTPERNLRFIEQVPVHAHALATFIPLPGTPIWRSPELFQCEILDRDFRKYNQWMWQRKDGEVQEAEYFPLIRNVLLTPDRQADNVYRMRRYVQESGKLQPG